MNGSNVERRVPPYVQPRPQQTLLDNTNHQDIVKECCNNRRYKLDEKNVSYGHSILRKHFIWNNI